MRLLPILLLIGTAAAQQEQFQTKFMNLVTDYLGPANTRKAMDMVAQDLLALKTIEEVMQHLKKDFMGLIPGDKLVSGGMMLTKFMNCVKSAGSSMDKAMATIIGAFTKQLTPLYKKVMTKVKAMKKNKKDDKSILNQGFKIATSALTKKLVQGVINACMAKSTKAEYDCAVPAMNTILKTKLYNMEYDKKRG